MKGPSEEALYSIKTQRRIRALGKENLTLRRVQVPEGGVIRQNDYTEHLVGI